MFVSAIIAAGGRGRRLGAARPKQLLEIGGRQILERSVAAFLSHSGIDEIVVALPGELAAAPPAYLFDCGKPIRIVSGGDRRQDSVASAFRAIADEADLVVVHDAARPFVSARLIEQTIAAAVECGAALAAIRASDTVKVAAVQHDDWWIVRETLPRESVFLAQTPQAFRREVLQRALALAETATDEAALAERLGQQVRIVQGEASNIKITTADDLILAQGLIDRGTIPPVVVDRAGTGYDLHRLVSGRPLVIGGVTIPFPRGALGHSDADVVCHAVTDAILGAAGLGDIGSHFPDSDPRWKGAASLDLLARSVALVRQRGYEVSNVDVTVLLEAPKLRPYIEEMRAAVARTIGTVPEVVSIKGKTNEGVDAVGRGEAIAAHAVALLRKWVP